MNSSQLKKGNLVWILNWDKENELYQTIRGKEGNKHIIGVWQKASERKIKSLIAHKKRLGYSELGDIVPKFACMLGENIKKKAPLYPVIAEYKYDGVRLLIPEEGIYTKDDLGHLSRKITYFVEIKKQTDIIRAILAKYLETEDFLLDGELYNHDIGFEGCSTMLKFNPDKTEIDEDWLAKRSFISKHSQFYWYDIAIVGYTLQERIALRNKVYKYFASRFNSDRIINVPNSTVNSQDEADILFKKAVSEGFEGLMLKRPTAYYEQKRTPNMIKYKKVEDMEVTIVDVIEGNGERKGVMGRLTVEYTVNDKIIHQHIDLKSSDKVRVNRALLKEILENKEILIGSKITVEFMELTSSGKMKLGKGLASTITLKTIRNFE